MIVTIGDEKLMLLPQKAVFWESEKMLMFADLHFGKTGHFRKSGIAVPKVVDKEMMEIMVGLIHRFVPEQVVFLGDLFHSHYNYGWEEFGEIVSHFSAISFTLVTGNHDILSEQQYKRKNIRICDRLLIKSFELTHHPQETSDRYNLAGHIHPGVRLYGKGKQTEILPCFHFGIKGGVLPSFGIFTGLAKISPEEGDKVFVIADNQIVAVA